MVDLDPVDLEDVEDADDADDSDDSDESDGVDLTSRLDKGFLKGFLEIVEMLLVDVDRGIANGLGFGVLIAGGRPDRHMEDLDATGGFRGLVFSLKSSPVDTGATGSTRRLLRGEG